VVAAKVFKEGENYARKCSGMKKPAARARARTAGNRIQSAQSLHSHLRPNFVQRAACPHPVNLLLVVGVQHIEGVGGAVGVVEADLQGLAGSVALPFVIFHYHLLT